MSASFILKNQPAPSGIFIDLGGLVFQRGIGGGDFAADRGIDVAGGLDAFHHRGLAAGATLLPPGGQFHKHHIAQLLGGIFGDADGGLVAVEADPFMLVGIT